MLKQGLGRRMGGALAIPITSFSKVMGFAKSSTHPTGYLLQGRVVIGWLQFPCVEWHNPRSHFAGSSSVQVAEQVAMILDHVSSALSATGVQAEILSAPENKALVVRLRERLGVDVRAHAPWDDKAESSGKLRSDGWELIPAFVGATACYVFLDGADIIWKFGNGSDLLHVLKECPALEFYVSDRDASYLLCRNHHDFIIGWGAARPWVDRLGTA